MRAGPRSGREAAKRAWSRAREAGTTFLGRRGEFKKFASGIAVGAARPRSGRNFPAAKRPVFLRAGVSPAAKRAGPRGGLQEVKRAGQRAREAGTTFLGKERGACGRRPEDGRFCRLLSLIQFPGSWGKGGRTANRERRAGSRVLPAAAPSPPLCTHRKGGGGASRPQQPRKALRLPPAKRSTTQRALRPDARA
jgi:hypothetical protein